MIGEGWLLETKSLGSQIIRKRRKKSRTWYYQPVPVLNNESRLKVNIMQSYSVADITHCSYHNVWCSRCLYEWTTILFFPSPGSSANVWEVIYYEIFLFGFCTSVSNILSNWRIFNYTYLVIHLGRQLKWHHFGSHCEVWSVFLISVRMSLF